MEDEVKQADTPAEEPADDERHTYGSVTDAEMKALDALEGKLFEPETVNEAEEGKPDPNRPEDQAEEAEETEESEPEADAEQEEGGDEPEEPEAELPDSLDSLAEAYEKTPRELADLLKVKVKVDGEESEVSLWEAIQGYQRQSDYSRSHDRLAEERKAVEAERAEASKAVESEVETLKGLAAALMKDLEGQTEQDLVAMYLDETSENYDPEAFFREKSRLDTRQRSLHETFSTIQGYQQRQQQMQTQQTAEYRAAQQKKLAESVPAFADPEKAGKISNDIKSMMVEAYDFKPEEIDAWFSGPFDARHVRIAMDAQKYRAMEKAKPKKVVGKSRVLKPGAAKSKGDQQSEQKAQIRRRLKTGSSRSRDDAALVLLDAKIR